MKKLNKLFYTFWLPIFLLTIGLLFYFPIDWVTVFLSWVVLGPIASGVAMHRLFAHRSFETHPIIEKILAYLATLSGYAPILFWVAQHQYHHAHADTNNDPTSPKHQGFLNTFFYWRFLKENDAKIFLRGYCSKMVLRDKYLMFLTTHFYKILWIHVIVLALISPALLLSLYLIPIIIESLRLGVLNSISHIENFPFNYRNYEVKDTACNNVIFGYLSLGFGWHNNHHAHPKKLLLHDKWWEIDIEGYIGYLLSKLRY